MELVMLGALIFTGLVLLLFIICSMMAVKYLEEEMYGRRSDENLPSVCREEDERGNLGGVGGKHGVSRTDSVFSEPERSIQGRTCRTHRNPCEHTGEI